MAIEFQCPYCSAAIRVPDSSGGKHGKCPACTSRILVPRVSATAPAAEPAKAAPPATVSRGGKASGKAAASAPEEPRFPGAAPEAAAPPTVASATDGTAAAPAAAVGAPLVSAEELPFQESPGGSIARAVKRRRRKRRGLGSILIPLLFLGAFGGGIAALVLREKPKAEGEMTAKALAEDFAVPAQYVLPHEGDVDEETVKRVLSALQENSPTMFSDRMRMRFRAEEKRGLEVNIESGEKTGFVVFDPRTRSALAKYCTDNLSTFEARHRAELRAATKAFFVSYGQSLDAGEPIANLPGFRDSVGVNAMTGGVGYVVEAVAGEIASRCVFEDGEGRLFFLLPKEAKSFELRGRRIADGSMPFVGTYRIRIEALPKKPDSQPAEEKPSDEKEPESDPEGMEKPEPETMEKPDPDAKPEKPEPKKPVKKDSTASE